MTFPYIAPSTAILHQSICGEHPLPFCPIDDATRGYPISPPKKAMPTNVHTENCCSRHAQFASAGLQEPRIRHPNSLLAWAAQEHDNVCNRHQSDAPSTRPLAVKKLLGGTHEFAHPSCTRHAFRSCPRQH